MNIAIIDDLREDIMLTEKYIRNYFTNYHSSIKPDIDLYSSGEEFLNSFKPNKYEIIFIDIYMNGITGIQTAKEIFKEDKSACIIFLTTSDEHYAESFSVQAVYYILKPVSKNETVFKEALDFCMTRLALDDKALEIKNGNFSANILFKNILYIESEIGETFLHINNHGPISVPGKFTEYANKLKNDERFIEIYRNLYINLDYVKKFKDDTVILKNDEVLPVARRRKTAALNSFTDYCIWKGASSK